MFTKFLSKIIPWRLTAKLRNHRRRPLWLEQLEDRCLMTTTIAEFPASASTSPFAITTGSDGNLWFTENQAGQIGMINPTTHAVTEFTIPTASSGPMGIVAGPDGNLWFTEANANQIGMIDLTTHTISEFALPTASSQPSEITAGPDGNLWFTELAAGKIASINPATHTVTESLSCPPPVRRPACCGSDGNSCRGEQQQQDRLNGIRDSHGGRSAHGVTAGPDGNIWFTENGVNIGVINPVTHDTTSWRFTINTVWSAQCRWTAIFGSPNSTATNRPVILPARIIVEYRRRRGAPRHHQRSRHALVAESNVDQIARSSPTRSSPPCPATDHRERTIHHLSRQRRL